LSKNRVYPPKKGKFSGENDEAVDLGVPFWKKKTWLSTTTYIYKAPQPSFCFAMGEHAEEWCQLSRGSDGWRHDATGAIFVM